MIPASIKKFAFALGARSALVPWTMNVARYLMRATARVPSRFKANRPYRQWGGTISPDPSATYINDHGTNFYVRAILENRYDYVIELGALTLGRSRRLAQLFPAVRVFGLDIAPDFEAGGLIDGVNVALNTPETILRIAETEHGRGAILAHGTLCYYSQTDLARLFSDARRLGLDLVFSEPNTVFEESLDRSMMRTPDSYYHPYLPMLRALGFILPDNKGKQARDCVSDYGEVRTFIFARNPDQASS